MQALGQIILETLSEVATTASYALIDYPDYLNPGDAAIWLGARRALDALNGGPPAYTSTLRGFSLSQCRRAIGEGKVYFLGGGNFGDLYPRHHRMRLDVLRVLPDNPIVQLPMSCAFASSPDDALLAETRELYRNHTSLRIFARERRARSDLEKHFALDSTLCPDLCHMLDLNAPPARSETVRLMRRDPEAAAHGTPRAPDWRDTRGQILANRLGKLLLAMTPPAFHCATQDRVAARKVDCAVTTLSQGLKVETDRLHAALLGIAIGRRVALHDNMTGKVLAYRETWGALLPELFELPDSGIPHPGGNG